MDERKPQALSLRARIVAFVWTLGTLAVLEGAAILPSYVALLIAIGFYCLLILPLIGK